MPLILLSSLDQPADHDQDALKVAAFADVLTKPSALLNPLMTIASGEPIRVVQRKGAQKNQFDEGFARQVPARILLSGDRPTNQKLGRMILTRLGYAADVAANGVEDPPARYPSGKPSAIRVAAYTYRNRRQRCNLLQTSWNFHNL